MILKNYQIVDATNPTPYSGSMHILDGKIHEIGKVSATLINEKIIRMKGKLGVVDLFVLKGSPLEDLSLLRKRSI